MSEVILTNFWKRLLCRHDGKLDFVGDVHGDHINCHNGARSVWQCPDCGKYLYKRYLGSEVIYIPNTGIGDVSDGYHTFNELYDHRAKLFATVCHGHQDLAWKSLRHEDGSMYDGMFIVGIDTPLGQATYHYDIDHYWDMFKVKEFERAPKWDGHTACDAIQRIYSLRWLKGRGDAPYVLYLCDRKACDPCDNPDCHRTYDIRHALNFERVQGSTYLWVEKETSDEQTP